MCEAHAAQAGSYIMGSPMPTPLEQEFVRLKTTTLRDERYANIRVGRDPDDQEKWWAHVSIIGGGVGGGGKTPEEAIATAVTNFIDLYHNTVEGARPQPEKRKRRKRNG